MKFNDKFEIWKYIRSAILISFILLFLFYFKIKTYDLVSVIGPIIFAYILFFVERGKINISSYKLILLILLCILSLSYGFDYVINRDSYMQSADNQEVYLEVNAYAEIEGQENLEGNYSPERYASQETTISVRYITPSQLENEFMNEDNSYISNVSDKIINKLLFLSSTFYADISNISKYYSKSVEIAREKINIALHIEDGYPISELNGNQEVTQLLEKANVIDLLVKKDNTIENNIKLKDKYHEAYELAPCSIISLQLARPYEEIILIYPRNSYGECDRIIEFGAKGIEIFLQTLAFKEKSQSTDGDIIYRIAKIYHCLGDLPNLDIKYRTEMYQISSAYFELSIFLKDEDDEYNAHKPYYAAMVNHKLGVISNEDNSFYLRRALDFYQQSLLYNEIKEQMASDANGYSAEICYRLIDYIETYGQKNELKSIETYEELATGYGERYKY